MKRTLAVILTATMILTACGGSSSEPASTTAATTTAGDSGAAETQAASSGEKNSYTLSTGSSGAQYFAFGTAMANEINNKSDKISVTALTANGVSEVINLVQSGETDFGFITYDTGYMAVTNQREYEGGPTYDNIRVAMLGHTGVKTIAVWADSPYQTIADLANAKLATASGTSAYALDSAAYGAWGVEIPEDVTTMGYGEMAQAIKDGVIDVVNAHGPNPSSYIMEMLADKPIRILGQTEETLKTILDAHPEWVRATIPAGIYEGVDEDVLSFGNYSCIICRKDIPDEDVAEFLDIVFAMDLTTLYPYGDTWGYNNDNYEAAYANNDVFPFHPGAEAWLKEHGLIKE